MAENKSPSGAAGRVVGALIKAAPVVVIAAVAVALSLLLRNATVEDILRYTPKSLPLAALVVVAVYAVKSLSVMLPLMVLYISVGTVFPPAAAILVNLIGLCVCVTIPYFLGRLVGREWVDKLVNRYKGAKFLNELGNSSQLFFSYILRVINLLPGDIVSLSLGASGITYLKYLSGSILGLLPTMIAATFLGVNIMEPKSPEFIISLFVTVLISVISMCVYVLLVKKRAGQ